ncbi:MAG: amino acid ABC transporter substrate-binding protein [Solirubrobacterales bacterium]|nr:amino acid ABC transporter substrate-binding protein [Solirubrobacterales bacterium]
MKKSRLVLLMTALAVMSALVLAACGSDDSSSSSSSSSDLSSELVTPGTLLVGSDIPYPPFEFGDAPDYKGFDIDLVNAIAGELDLTPDIQDTSFDTVFTDVAQGKFDMVASASTITPERQKVVNFSDPYYDSAQALVVPTGSDITSVDDLAGKNVGAQNGTTGQAYAKKETDAARVQGYPNGPAAIAAVKNGQVDATIIDQPVAQDAVKKGQTGFEVATVIPTGELYGFAFSKNSPALLEGVNEALGTLKENGELNKIYQEWFQIDAPETVLNGITAAQ